MLTFSNLLKDFLYTLYQKSFDLSSRFHAVTARQIERLVAIVLPSDPALLVWEEDRAQVMKEIEAFRREVQQALTPYARPTRVACKRCYFRMRHAPPMWRDFCLLELVRRQCGAIAFASDVTLWDELATRVRALTPSAEVFTRPTV